MVHSYKQHRDLFARVVKFSFAVLACIYLAYASLVAWKIQSGNGSVYTAILAGIISLPWSMLIPRNAQSPLVLSCLTLTAPIANTMLGWIAMSRIQRLIFRRGIE